MSEDDRERWNERHRTTAPPGEPPTWLLELGDELPRTGHALDVASGKGALALWLAERGLEVTAVDVSEVALDALQDAATRRGVAVRTLRVDLEREAPPRGPFDLVACLHYRQPALLPTLAERLAPGGLLALEQHTVENLARHARPSRRFLAQPQELLRWALEADLAVVHYHEGWVGNRAVARLLARRAR